MSADDKAKPGTPRAQRAASRAAQQLIDDELTREATLRRQQAELDLENSIKQKEFIARREQREAARERREAEAADHASAMYEETGELPPPAANDLAEAMAGTMKDVLNDNRKEADHQRGIDRRAMEYHFSQQAELQAQSAKAAEEKRAKHRPTLNLPPFFVENPDHWFAHIECVFSTRNVTDEKWKFEYLASALDATTSAQVLDLISKPPALFPYAALKAALLRAFGRTEAQKMATLLSLNGLGDKKPSSMARYIKTLTKEPNSAPVLSIFRNQLPVEVRRILATSEAKTLEEVAAAADLIMEEEELALHRPLTRVNAVSAGDSDPPDDAHVFSLDPGVNRISRNRQASTTGPAKLCYVHYVYGNDAYTCRGPPCPRAGQPLAEKPDGNSGNANASRGNRGSRGRRYQRR